MKQHIVRTGLGPGDRLPTEIEWVEMLGVSRLVVREALQALAGMGLIEIQQGRGAFVRDIAQISVFDQLTFGLDLDQIGYADVIEARTMLDLAVIELCMLRASPVELGELDTTIEQMEQAERGGASSEDLHRAFHRQLLHAAGNPLIERIGLALLDTCWRISERVPNLIHPSAQPGGYRHAESHRALLDAIRARDLARSRQIVADHFPSQVGQVPIYPSSAELRIDALWTDV